RGLRMQLNIRQTLARATYTLLSGSAAVHANIDDNMKTEGAALFYSETGRVQVFEPVIQTTHILGDDKTLSLRLVIDIMSGASPSGAAPATVTQIFSSPSPGGNSTTVPATQLPLQEFSDQRVALSVDWDTPFNPTQKNLLGASFSKETDYTSFGVSDTLRTELNDKLTTLALGIAVNADGVNPAGGAPQPLTLKPTNFTTTNEEDERENEGFGKLKLGGSAFVGITQVVNRRLLMQLNYSRSLAAGYLNDPYKVVSVVDPLTGNPIAGNYLPEGRPNRRTSQTVFWKSVLHLPNDVVHFSYRYFWDDWGIRAHTVDLEYRFELGDGHFLRPHLRYHVQSAADFYHHSLVNGEPLPQYASADYRLAEMTSKTVGIKYGFSAGGKSQFGLRIERMLQSGNHHPANAIGAQRQLDLYPGLEAYIFQIDFSTTF
ncbi:MAG: DUF3570 domain-containing protein, partial [Gammaproteobacteria bacterium]|nr:DUF3570 domain-containing protein [Gammaproteobacteria bacterium]